MADEPKPVGRPSKYDPAYCGEVEAFLADGYSLEAFAGEIGVCRDTIYEWKNVHPEFSDAVKRATAKAVLWWEKANRKMATTGEGNATAIIFGLKNRAKEEWRDISRNELSGPDGAPVKFEGQTLTVVDPREA